MFGFSEFLFIIALAVVVFSAKHIPALLKSMGQSVTFFKKGLNETEERPTRTVRDLKSPTETKA